MPSIEATLPLSDIAAIIRDHVSDPEALTAIQKDLLAAAKEIAAAKEAEKANTPRGKTRLVAFVRGTPEMQKALDGGCWIASVPDDDTTATYAGQALLERLRKAVIAHNEAPKGRRKAKPRIETWFQAFTSLKAKTLKESGSTVTVKQKGVLVEVIVLTSETVVPPAR